VTHQPVNIIGNYLSPYVRKVLVFLDSKGIDYQIDPIVPFYGNDEFTAISPVRRIPVLLDDTVTLCDSTVICEYLEQKYPHPALYPSSPEDRARARWLEEFADTRLGEVLIWRLFNEVVIKRAVWGEKTDEAVVKRTLESEIPEVLDYLQAQLSQGQPSQARLSEGDSYFFGTLGIADIAVAAFFRNASFAGFSIDPERWPVIARFVANVLDQPSFKKLRPFEDLLMKTPIQRHREALGSIGAPLTQKTYGTETPRRGVLSI